MTDPAIGPDDRATAHVHLPRSLIALFPGTAKRLDAHGSTVAEVIDDLDRLIPGIRNRLLDAGPSIRTHLNVYVAGTRAGLDTPVPDGAVVHIIPAASGGNGHDQVLTLPTPGAARQRVAPQGSDHRTGRSPTPRSRRQ